MARQAPFMPRWFLLAAALVLLMPALTILLNLTPVQRVIVESLIRCARRDGDGAGGAV
jgi:hypothetical protein